MIYNLNTHYRYNPFQKQGFVPDVALQNRKMKQFPSEIPQGQQFFGRQYRGKKKLPLALGSQIGSLQLMKSPQKFAFENRIAMDKQYSRNLDTIDIEGACSGTRMSEAVRNKMRAREELMRTKKQFYSDMDSVEKTSEVKRREIAQKQYQKIQQIKETQKQAKQHKQQQALQRYRQIQQQINQTNNNAVSQQNANRVRNRSSMEFSGQGHQQAISDDVNRKRRQQIQYQQNMMNMSINNRHRNNPQYYNNYFTEYKKRLQEHKLNQQMEHELMQQHQYTNRKQFRSKNPTNLSFGLAGENVLRS